MSGAVDEVLEVVLGGRNGVRPAPNVAIERIGPRRAAELLELNTANRNPSRTKRAIYAAKMRADAWLFTGQAHVIVSWEPRLLNGQHTLGAVVDSGATITTVVVSGVDPAAFAAIDIGMGRTAAQVLAVGGVKSGNKVAGAIRCVESVDKIRAGDRSALALDTDEVVEIFQADPDGWTFATSQAVAAHNRLRRDAPAGFSPSGCAAFLYLARRDADVDPADLVTFVERVAADAGHRDGSPELTLRRWLLTRSTRGADATLAGCSAWIKAWNAVVQGRPLSKIYAWTRATTGFPEPLA